jgi:hypothetical protein
MPVPEIEKQKIIDKAFKDMEDDVIQKHKAYGWRTWGWVKNKWAATMGMSSTSKKATLGQVASKALSYVPLVGGFASFTVSQLASAYKTQALAEKMASSADPDEKLKVSGEFMVVKGAEDLATAVRKVMDAQNEVNKLLMNDKAAGKNCHLYLDFLSATMYYKYRISRLEYYLNIMYGYTVEVKKQLEQMKTKWPETEKVARECGMERLGDFWFHFDSCKGNPVCLYQEEWLKKYVEISGPTNVQGFNPRPGNSPVPPPLPPRPPRPFGKV